MDGIDIALLETDGESFLRHGAWSSRPYPEKLRSALLRLTGDGEDLQPYERQVTDAHIECVELFCRENNINLAAIDCIGFHGQTIRHEPLRRRTVQLGDGARMAQALSCLVVDRFRDNDLRQGGQGAPLVPAYHKALARSQGLAEPVAILNIGGVSNVTWIHDDELHACDCGPGNALIDDWVSARCGLPYDENGAIAARGRVDEEAVAALMKHPYFSISGAKSLDRNSFSTASLQRLSVEDGASTLTAFSAEAIAAASKLLPAPPLEWIVVGGGRLNKTLLQMLQRRLRVPVRTAEDLGWAGDAIEAQAFAYLAVRSILGLPLSWPGTTGVPAPATGGVRHDPT